MNTQRQNSQQIMQQLLKALMLEHANPVFYEGLVAEYELKYGVDKYSLEAHSYLEKEKK